MEIRPVKGFEEEYGVTRDGQVYSYRRKKFLKPILQGTGYYTVNLTKGKVRKLSHIHRLVAEAFIPNPENKPCIDHINTAKVDNRVENLKWCTSKENSNNPISKARQSEKMKGKGVGRKMPLDVRIKKACANYKRYHEGGLNDYEERLAKPIVQLSIDGTPVRSWNTSLEASQALKVRHRRILYCLEGKMKSLKGYMFKYQ